jgi:hypothetical protein
MNNQALQLAFNNAKSQGYNGDINSFKTLLSTNDNALKLAHSGATSGGYNGDINHFKNLLLGDSTPQQQPVTPPVTQQTNESEKNAFAQQIEITPTKIENFKKNKVENHITEFVFFLLFLFIALYFFHKRK